MVSKTMISAPKTWKILKVQKSHQKASRSLSSRVINEFEISQFRYLRVICTAQKFRDRKVVSTPQKFSDFFKKNGITKQ